MAHIPYTFTQPVRYYKSNDPYYYEVDNIPIRQLEENILYVKDRIEGLSDDDQGGGTFLTDKSELDITMIKQLRPKVISGRTVQVNAGRFVSRVNDAFDIAKPLNDLLFTNGPPLLPNVISTLSMEAFDEATTVKVWNSFVNGSVGGGDAYNINGLEFTHTFYASPGGVGSHYGWQVNPGPLYSGNWPFYKNMSGQWAQFWSAAWPNHNKFDALATKGMPEWVPEHDTGGWASDSWIADSLPSVHLSFVQRWRGVFRTAVVDMPQLTIQIPSWSDDDFWGQTSTAAFDRFLIPAVQRIDLLVAYSLPIDTSSTTLTDFETGFCTDPASQPPVAKTITAPILGIVRGAGVGIGPYPIDNASKPRSLPTSEDCASLGTPGSSRILANKWDSETIANQGITDINGSKVHGSFPSPDDLLNIAPVLAIDVKGSTTQDPNLELVGQAALPLAYILVKKGQANILPEDIIDIRPFLRTTEFTYNERAGIAAANPPLSFANPAVGAFQLQTVVNALTAQQAAGGGGGFKGIPLYTDYVMGGLAYGVEGTLLTMCDRTTQDAVDPWGTDTTTTTNFISKGNSQTYSFSWATSSKAFMEESNLSNKYALLEYFYRMRQGDLKKWLNNPNSSISTQTGTYLGLPGGTASRNIPLFPEWDMPVDGNTYSQVIGGTGVAMTNKAVPPATRWMWFEGLNANRALAYSPGGITYTLSQGGAGTVSNLLNTQIGFGWGIGATPNNANAVGSAGLACVNKNIDITFPQWVMAYDVLVEYVNCSPVTTAIPSPWQGLDNTGYAGFYGAGGLFVNKGAMVGNQATFSITSAASPVPEGSDGLINTNGVLADLSGTGASNTGRDKSAPNLDNKQYQWLAYSVCLPQFKQTRFNCMFQSDGPNKAITRYTPKFGAAFYPTVKFTIIAYNQEPVTTNSVYNTSVNNNTLIQNISMGATDALTYDTPVPLGGTARIDISNITIG